MLLIGDIHISSRLWPQIIQSLRSFIDTHSDEENIVFLWDYVYHFSYDRNAILELYTIFVELFKSGKNVYVLAGNHDRLWQHFVYAEAKKAFDIINTLEKWSTGKLYFITSPQTHTIEWEDIIFLPYMLQPEEIQDHREVWDEWRMRGVTTQIEELKKSGDKHKELSGKINSIVLHYAQKYYQQHQNVTIIHHYYFNKIKFPWQRARFYFKDIALSEFFLQAPHMKFLSWHLHQVFSYQNYLCIGSVRSTSSLENNQIKCLAQYNPKEKLVTLYQNEINPYIFIENTVQTADLFDEESSDKIVDESVLREHIHKITNQAQHNLGDQSVWKIRFVAQNKIDLHDITVNLKVQDLDYDKVDSYIDKSLRTQLKEIKLKKHEQNLSDLLQDFDLASKNLSQSLLDWKNVLKIYLQKTFGNEAEKYEKILRDENIL